jgi:hypothetical protein
VLGRTCAQRPSIHSRHNVRHPNPSRRYKLLRRESLKADPSLSPPTPSSPSSPALQSAIGRQFIKHKRLHAALSDNVPPPPGPAPLCSASEQGYLRTLSSLLSVRLLPAEHRSSPIVGELVNEILANAVLNPVMALFEPATVNGWIVAAGETAGVVAEAKKSASSFDDTAQFQMDTRIQASYRPGAAPLPSLEGGGSWRFFAGRMGALEAGMLLSDKSHRSFLLRVDAAEKDGEAAADLRLALSYVDEDQSKLPARRLSEAAAAGFDAMRGRAELRTRHLALSYASGGEGKGWK